MASRARVLRRAGGTSATRISLAAAPSSRRAASLAPKPGDVPDPPGSVTRLALAGADVRRSLGLLEGRLAQQDDPIPVLEGHGGHGLPAVDRRVLRSLDLDERAAELHRLRAVALRVHQRDAVGEVATPHALLPGARWRGAGRRAEIRIVLVEPDDPGITLRSVREAVVAVIHQTRGQAIAHRLVIGRIAPLIEDGELR